MVLLTTLRKILLASVVLFVRFILLSVPKKTWGENVSRNGVRCDGNLDLTHNTNEHESFGWGSRGMILLRKLSRSVQLLFVLGSTGAMVGFFVCFVASRHFNPEELRNPAFGKGIPFGFPHRLFSQGNSIFKGHTLPSCFHEITNIGMIGSIGIGFDLPIIFTPQF